MGVRVDWSTLARSLPLPIRHDQSHPLIALFQPLIEKSNKRLQENASQYYTQIEAFATDER